MNIDGLVGAKIEHKKETGVVDVTTKDIDKKEKRKKRKDTVPSHVEKKTWFTSPHVTVVETTIPIRRTSPPCVAKEKYMVS